MRLDGVGRGRNFTSIAFALPALCHTYCYNNNGLSPKSEPGALHPDRGNGMLDSASLREFLFLFFHCVLAASSSSSGLTDPALQRSAPYTATESAEPGVSPLPHHLFTDSISPRECPTDGRASGAMRCYFASDAGECGNKGKR